MKGRQKRFYDSCSRKGPPLNIQSDELNLLSCKERGENALSTVSLSKAGSQSDPAEGVGKREVQDWAGIGSRGRVSEWTLAVRVTWASCR